MVADKGEGGSGSRKISTQLELLRCPDDLCIVIWISVMIIFLTRGAKDYNVVFTFNRNFVRKNIRMASQYWVSDFSWADSNYSVLAFIETACHVGAIIVRKHYSKIHEHSDNDMLKAKPPYKKM